MCVQSVLGGECCYERRESITYTWCVYCVRIKNLYVREVYEGGGRGERG